MKLLPFSPAKTLLPAYRVQNVERNRLERFKTELVRLLEHVGNAPNESEEHLKNIVSDFLKNAFYREEHFVNTKDRQELLRYYLNERIGLDNKEIRHLVVTDIHVWYIFDAADFERHVYANKKLQQQYTDWREGRIGANVTDWFYREITAPFFETELPELRCCRHERPGGGGVVYGLYGLTEEEIAIIENQ